MVEKRERRRGGTNKKRKVRGRLTRGSRPGVGQTIAVPIQIPLATDPTAEARNPSRNFPLRRPSRGPPGAIGLATPFLRHLARPKAAEMTERAKVVKNSSQATLKLGEIPNIQVNRLEE